MQLSLPDTHTPLPFLHHLLSYIISYPTYLPPLPCIKELHVCFCLLDRNSAFYLCLYKILLTAEENCVLWLLLLPCRSVLLQLITDLFLHWVFYAFIFNSTLNFALKALRCIISSYQFYYFQITPRAFGLTPIQAWHPWILLETFSSAWPSELPGSHTLTSFFDL